MKKANNFYNWFRDLGGNTNDIDVSDIVGKLNQPTFHVSTLKGRANEIKEKYNYKFN